jgi:drug/metabolite transporter, DME family
MAMTGVLVGLLCAMTWAGAAIMLRSLAHKLDPFTLNAPRSLIGAVCMLGLLLVTGKSSGFQAVTPLKLCFMLASIGIGGGIGDTFYVSSLKRIGVSRAFPISSTYPALTLIFGLLFLGDTLRLAVVAGLVLVLGGILLISRPAGREVRADPAAGSFRGVGFALVASLCWAISMTLLAPGIQGIDSVVVSAIRVPALSLLLWAVVAVRKSARSLLTLSRREWWVLVLSGFVGWGLGSILFVVTVALIGSARAAILTSTAPLFALPLSALLLREKITRTVWLGTALTVVGIVLVS